MKRKRQDSYNTGLIAEFFAAFYLVLKGFKVIHRRYKTPFGEIDILACKKNVLVAVEVKFRKQGDSSFGHVLETIHAKNQKRVEKALLHFIASHPAYAGFEVRFDVICFSGPFRLHHLDNAWQARS